MLSIFFKSFSFEKLESADVDIFLQLKFNGLLYNVSKMERTGKYGYPYW